VDREIVKRYGLQVKNGPLSGMRYINIPPYRGLSAKLLGTYEQELHPVIEQAIQEQYKTLINVGSAEGCYAIGYAVKVPETIVYAFDIDERERQFCDLLATTNNVRDRVHIRERCDVEDLEMLITDKTLVIMDCEGCEAELLRPDLAPKLYEADILVELHDFAADGVIETIRNRFGESHEITEINYQGRNPDDVPDVQFLPSDEQRRIAVMERDVASQTWLFMRAKR
jgi:hypothetical protein